MSDNDSSYFLECMERTELDLFVENICEYVWEVREETDEIPNYGKQTLGIGEGENENVFFPQIVLRTKGFLR